MQSKNGTQTLTKTIAKCLCGKNRMSGRRKCLGCIRLDGRKKRLEKLQQKLERKVKTKKYQKSEWKKWHAKAWKVFSGYIRRRAADWRGNAQCITCDKQFHWKELHAGHFKHGKLDFDPMNINPQCAADNTYKGGKLDVYALKLIDMYGLEAVKSLELRANTKIYSLDELKEVYLKYSELIKQL